MNIPNDKSLAGSIVLERGTTFLAKQIVMHMFIYAIQRFRKPLKYSHAETLLWDEENQILVTSGARQHNSRAIKLEDYYNDGNDIMILKPIIELSDREIRKQWEYYNIIKDNKYQVSNFISWLFYIRTLIWIGEMGDKRTYCYELAARYANIVGRYNGDLDKVTSYNLYDNSSYKEFKIN